MTLKVDAGGIVAQRRVDLPEGVSGPEAEVLLAGVGGQLMLAMLAHLAVGHLLLTAQDEARQSYQPWPTERNFRLSPEWAARRAFNFIRGTRHWGRHYVLELTAESFLIAEALFYDEQARLDQPYMLAGTELHVQCTPGVLVVRLADGM